MSFFGTEWNEYEHDERMRWKRYEARPTCDECGAKITDDECYKLYGYTICLECMESFRTEVMEDDE